MATAASPVPAPEGPTPINHFGRILGIFFSPKTTFESIVKNPTWLLPMALLTVLSILVSVGINQRIDWREFISQQIEKSPSAAQMSTEQKQQRIEAGAKISPPFTYVAGALGPAILALLVSLLMWGAFSLLGGITTNFGTAFGITAHAFLTGLVSSPLFFLILYLKPFGTVDLDNPIASNLASFLSEDAPKWLIALGKSIDVFSFWTLALLAIGFAAVNPKKLKGLKPYTIAFSVWGFYVAVRAGWAFITS